MSSVIKLKVMFHIKCVVHMVILWDIERCSAPRFIATSDCRVGVGAMS